MSLINPIGHRIGSSHIWKYRNSLFFNTKLYNNSIKDLYFLPSFLQNLMDRKYFRKYDYYFSHLSAHRYNSGLISYNLFFASRFLRSVYDWFFRYFLVQLNNFFKKRKLKKSYLFKNKRLKLKKYSIHYKNVVEIINYKIFYKIYNLVYTSLRSFYSLVKMYTNYKEVKLNFFVIGETCLSAYALGSIFKNRLKRGGSLNRLVRSTFQLMKKGKYRSIAGLRIVCEGRFKRRQRAQHDVFSIGRVKTSSFGSKMDYSLNTVYLKYGAGSVRIWLNYK
jgi:hypothetical protein